MLLFEHRARAILATGVVCLAVAACSSSPASSSPDGSMPDAPSDGTGVISSTVVIGTAGGTVSAGGASVVVPAGALSAPTSITVAVASDAPPLPANVTLIGSIFSFTPHGQAFASPVTINIPFTAPATGAPELYGASADDEIWAPVTGAPATNGVLSTQVMHFSWFAPATTSLTCGQIGAACGGNSPGCCYHQDYDVQCDFNGTLICQTVYGPCTEATDCVGGNLGKTGCAAGHCCTETSYPCSADDQCCSRGCSAGGLCL